MTRDWHHRGLALVALLLLALGAVGMGHRAPSLTALALAPYAQVGVSLADICGMDEMGEGADPCPLCRIEPGFTPPTPPRLGGMGLQAGREIAFVAPGKPVALPIRDPGKGPRAPPIA